MAVTATTFTPDPIGSGWNVAPGTVQGYTDIPRQEVQFMVKDGAITAGGAGNEQAVTVDCNLPRNFAYVLMELTFSIRITTSGGAMNWPSAAMAKFYDADWLNSLHTFEIPIEGKSHGNAPLYYLNSMFNNRVYCFDCLPNMVVWSRDATSAPELVVDLLNDTQNDGAAEINFFARFLQYDIEQARNYSVNKPTLMR